MADSCLGGLSVTMLGQKARDWGSIPVETEYFYPSEPTVTVSNMFENFSESRQSMRESQTGIEGGYNQGLRDRNSGRLQSGTLLIQINDHPVCANYCTCPSSNYRHPGRIDRTEGLMGFLQ